MCISQTRTYWKAGTDILSLEMQKWNISGYRAQKVDKKNDIIRLVLFFPKVVVKWPIYVLYAE